MGTENTCSKIILIVLNLVFITAGALFFYYGLNLKQSRWTNISTSVRDFGTGVTVFGGLIIVIALFGLLGTICWNKCLLGIYGIFVFTAMAVFVALAVIVFMSSSSAKTWKTSDYPASENEPTVANGFNKIYCYAQGANLCMSTSAKDAISIFVPGVDDLFERTLSLLNFNLSSKTGINGFCESAAAKIDESGSVGALAQNLFPPEYTKVCSICKNVSNHFSNYSSIFQWAEDQCPFEPSTAFWCVKFLSTGTGGDIYVGAPYKQCRPAVLNFWSFFANTAGYVFTIMGVATLVLLFMVCSAGRQKYEDNYSGDV
jgi:hypothetical protein